MRAAFLVLAVLLAPLAAARPILTTDPTNVDLPPGGDALVQVRASGIDDDGGVYDLFVGTTDLDVRFVDGGPPQGITYLPGRETSQTFAARIAAPDAAQDGAHEVTFVLVERPPVSGRPQSANATVLARVGSPAQDAPATQVEDVASQEPASEFARAWPLLVAGGAVVLGVGAPIYLWRRGWLGGLLYWRIRDERLLDHSVRGAIVERVRREPGITLAQLQRDLMLSDGQLDHHVRRLVRSRLLVKVERDGARYLYLPGDPVALAPPLATLVREALAGGDPLSAGEVALRVGTTPQHARYYLEKMVREREALAEESGGRRSYRRA